MYTIIPAKGIRLQNLTATEMAYKQHYLDKYVAQGSVIWYAFHPFKIRLAVSLFYLPSCLVQLSDGEVQIHDIYPLKVARPHLLSPQARVAASMLPFLYKAIEIDPANPEKMRETIIPGVNAFPQGRKRIKLEG